MTRKTSTVIVVIFCCNLVFGETSLVEENPDTKRHKHRGHEGLYNV